MCADPNKEQAKLEKHKRDYAFRSAELKHLNSYTSYIRGQAAAATGLSRTKSDLYTRALQVQSQGRLLAQQAEAAYRQKQFAGFAGGGSASRTAGRGDFLALLAKQSQIESKISNTFGRDMSTALQGVGRQYENKLAMNRERLGLPPTYGPAVGYLKQSLWQRTAPVREMIAFATGTTVNSDGDNIFGFKA